jgi:hypothetical protein
MKPPQNINAQNGPFATGARQSVCRVSVYHVFEHWFHDLISATTTAAGSLK